jgi:hypothetical protein
MWIIMEQGVTQLIFVDKFVQEFVQVVQFPHSGSFRRPTRFYRIVLLIDGALDTS